MDNVDVCELDAFVFLVENEYNKIYYSENTNVHFKLQLNLLEFVIIQNSCYPYLVPLEKLPY